MASALPPLALAIVAIGFPIVLTNPFFIALANQVFLNAAVAVSLSVLLGTTGQLSLGHAAFVALGAYGSALLAQHGVAVPASILIATILVGLLGWGLARLFLRLAGYYLAIATLGVGLVVAVVLRNEKEITGGIDGLTVEPLALWGADIYSEVVWYYILLAALTLIIAATLTLLKSPAGRALRALHDAETAAIALGVDTLRLKVQVFVYSAALAALMGALYAHYVGFISPNAASFHRSVEFVMMVVIGGIGSIAGAVLGALIITLLPVTLADFEQFETLVAGSILLATLIFLPEGLVRPVKRIWRRRVS
ncbi:branched-chain amino acid ABC transporter permease [Azospirillum sp. INR13]|uniref:branched-chain amino acid ABC transporter permease n=1 Tax=Azospirillum sp. INR13 TaxID=2596919 RepID=UPI0018927FFA|nr:branched-chain amino acid ABC transporter permease [Azospirillum sp. INR13]